MSPSTDIMTASSAMPAPRSWPERLWSNIADRGRPYAHVPEASAPPLDRLKRLAEALLSERGEASGAAVARELHVVLRGLNSADRTGFYRFLADGFGPDPDRLRKAAEAWLAEPNGEAAARLADAAEPPRQELLRRMNMASGGTAALVKIRQELGGMLRTEPGLRLLDADLRHLFASWFNRGFLELRRIDWQTPAAVLEKLIRYEAVHEIQGWDDLRRRLAADRRCFGFFHPALPGTWSRCSSGCTASAMPRTSATSTKISGSPGRAGWKKAKQRRSAASRRRIFGAGRRGQQRRLLRAEQPLLRRRGHLPLQPAAEARHRRQRREAPELRQLGLQLLDHLLDQEIAEGDAA